mmetsp:Transcript_3992/g.11349  ORF Transcript_3992/g.11349 Transcript_3992/m.11349 type:complete len:222 (-) Transcript_3992:353-1018(-)
MAASPLCKGMDDYRGSPLKRFRQIWCRKSIVDDQWDASFLGNLAKLLQGGDLKGGVADCFAKDGARVFVNRILDSLGVANVHKVGVDAELGKDVVELGISSTVEVASRHKVIPLLAQVDDRVEGGCGTGTQSKAGGTALHGGESLLQHIGRGIPDACVDVAKLFQSEELGGLVATFKHVGRRAIKWHTARSCRVGQVPTVQTNRIETTDQVGILAHLQLRR